MAIGSVLTALGIAALKGEAKAAARRMGRRAAFAATTVVFLVLAFSFGLAALTVWLAGELGVLVALLIVAATMLILALIVQLVAMLSERSSSKPRSQPFRPQMAAAAGLGQGPGDGASDAEAPVGSAVGSLAVIAVVGFVLARRLFKR